jgi:hypothetical protein
MTARTPAQAVAGARRTKTFPVGMCLVFVRTQFGVPAHFGSAAEAWRGAKFKHPVDSGMQVPRGAPVFWTGGSKGFGHIAIGTGNGRCWSSDAGGAGKTAKVNIDELTDRFNITFQGWAEDINGVHVFDASKKSKGQAIPTVRLKQVQPDPREDVRKVQSALKRRLPKAAKDLAVDGYFGPITQHVYAAWQRRCGFTGAAADGIPGRITLQRLGFDVS